MDNLEPSTVKKPSGIKPPSALPKLAEISTTMPSLGEISESQLNSKIAVPKPSGIAKAPSKQHTAIDTAKEARRKRLMASTAAGTMRGGSVPPRETLMERAGRTNRSSVPPPSVRTNVAGVSLASAGIRNTSTASSRSSRSTASSGSRYTSNSSYGSSTTNTRPTTAYGTYGHNRGLSQSTRGPPLKRSATALGDRDDPAGADGKRQGTYGFSSTRVQPSTAGTFAQSYSGAIGSGTESLTIRKMRSPRKTVAGDASIFAPPRKPSSREASISTKLGGLKLGNLTNGQSWSPGSGKGSSPKSKLSGQGDMGPPPAVRRRGETISSATGSIPLSNYSKDSSFTSRDDKYPPQCPKTPSFIPLPITKSEAPVRAATPDTFTPTKSRNGTRAKSPTKDPIPLFLTKDSNVTTFTAWDVDGRLEKMESMYEKMQSTIESTQLKDQGLEEAVNHYKIRLVELESKNASLETRGAHLDSRISILDSQLLSQQAELDSARQRISSITSQADDDVRAARRKLDDAMHEHQREVKLLKKEMDEELERMKRTYQQSSGSEMERMMQQHRQEIEELHRQSRQLLLEEERRRMQEVSEIQQRVQVQEQNLDAAVGTRDQQITQLSRELQTTQEALENEKNLRGSVQNALTASSASVISLEAKVLSLQDRIQFLESGSKAQSDRFALMEQQLHDALEATKESKAKLIHEETLRRILFNQVQELKGNIRVMCRVRPPMRDETCVTIRYPDLDTESKALELLGPEEKSSLGTVSRKTNAFSFDRVFGPSNQNEDVFAEISQLVQSALDGYNVCIFAYGQTGAGKTHTMSSADGMIPRTAKMIYQQAKDLEDKGWRYTMEGSFVEVYNEEIHDLLGSPRDLDRVKHEIRHDDRKKQTTVTNLKTVELDSADAVNGILTRADANRSVAATKSNERSSRSHSVFILKLVGRNSTTGDVSEGTLNLVDLAGSERLKQSGAEGDRMKETQNINKSLSCLGDVIGALGQGKEGGHIPYRNSKLTYLLQYSLGGNSKTLMFVMVSPLEAHLKETLTSLKFATKVHNTHIGTARKSKRQE